MLNNKIQNKGVFIRFLSTRLKVHFKSALKLLTVYKKQGNYYDRGNKTSTRTKHKVSNNSFSIV